MSGILRHSLRHIVPRMTSNVTSKATIIAGPPKNPISLAEKVFLGGGMCVAIFFPMFWVITNIQYYKNPQGTASESE